MYLTKSDKFWKKFKPILVTKLTGPITHSEYNPDGCMLVITASSQIKLLDGKNLSWIGNIGQFSNTAYSASFRLDGKLVVAGGENSVVQVFDVTTRNLMRKLYGHTGPIHCTRFSINNTHILSGSDDATICTWDISRGSRVSRLVGHTDYIRTASNSPTNSNVWLTGCYDHTVRLWDTRTNSYTLTMDHGSAVQDVQILGSGTLCVSSGGNDTCIWDLHSGGKLLKKIENKKSSCFCITSEMTSDLIPRLIIGTLDGNVKVYEMCSFKVSNCWKYHFPVLALAASSNSCSIAVGLADGTFCLRKFSQRGSSSVRVRAPLLKSHAQTFDKSLNNWKKNGSIVKKLRVIPDSILRFKNIYFRSKLFRYTDAIGAALSSRSPKVVMATIEEYRNRGILSKVLNNCKSAQIASILDFLSKYLNTPSYTRTLINVLTLCLNADAFKLDGNKRLTQKSVYLSHVVSREVLFVEKLRNLNGFLELLLDQRLPK